MKKILDGITIEIEDYLVIVTYDKKKNFSEYFLNTVRQLMEIAFPLYRINFIEKDEIGDVNG